MIDVTLIPILSDNDSYLLESDNGDIAVVDPGEAAPIIAALEERNLKPDMILITHYHGDHVAGLDELLAWRECPVMGFNHDDASNFEFGGEEVQVIGTPGHKRDHVSFYLPESQLVFCGDTLFVMGCGRVLDGTAEELYASLQKLASLPDDTRVYCGHEYTLSNAEFCSHIAPNDAGITARLSAVKEMRSNDQPTVPSTIVLEKETNVFLKAKSAAEFATLRLEKDNF